MISNSDCLRETTKLVSKQKYRLRIRFMDGLITCCHGQQLYIYKIIEASIRSHRWSPKHRGNRILVAMGNNWIQYGGYIKFREELIKWSLANRKWLCLLPGATTGFQYGWQTWNRGQCSQNSPQTGSRILVQSYYLRLYKSNVIETNKQISK